MSTRKEPINRRALVVYARLLLDWLGWIYIDRVLVLEGRERGTLPEHFLQVAFDDWDEALREAPAALLETRRLRLVVEEALAEAQLRMAERFAPSVGRERIAELARGFGGAIDRARFVVTRGQRFRRWLREAVALPAPPPSGSTPDDLRLRVRVDALSDDERRQTTEMTLDCGETLTDLTPLARLRFLRRVRIQGAPLLVDISPLGGLPDLDDLYVSAPTLRDLAPIERMARLRRLVLDADRDLDLSPLRSLSLLEELSVGDCDDLSPLEALTSLKTLSIDAGHGAPSLEPLRGLVGLRDLSVGSMKDDPMGVVVSLRSLVSLKIGSCKALVDTSALAQLTELETLDLALSPVGDLTPLGSLKKLRVLDLFGARRDLSDAHLRMLPPLRDLPCLEELSMRLTSLQGLAGVEHGRALRKLGVGPSDARGFSDLTPLAGLFHLEELDLDGLTHVADVSPLRGLTGLRMLRIGESAVRDLTPLSGLTALERLDLSDTPVETLEALAGLPQLAHLWLARCAALRSIRPLAACPALQSVDCEDCDALQGPTSVEQLRAPVVAPTPAKRYPSAGLPVNRAGAVPAFDARAHLPKRPPEGWALPERASDDDAMFWLDAEHRVRISMMLLSRDDAHLVMVYMWRHDRTALTDKEAARILRRFRASDAFVETDDTPLVEEPGIRCFIARAHAATPDTWGASRVRGALMRVEEGADDEAALGRGAPASDVRHQLPSPLPGGWSVRPTTKEPEDVACRISVPEAELTVLLRMVPSSDQLQLVVSIGPPRGSSAKIVSDELARRMLAQFRGRGVFEESNFGPFARAPGVRMFIAPIGRATADRSSRG
jgi:Leucine-rich repeat (LRR) protein